MELLRQLNELEKSYEGLDDLECSPVHAALTKRMRKTLYAGRVDAEGISLPLTEIVVELFQNADQRHLGQLSKRHVANLTRRSNATQCSLFLSMIYTKRLRECNPDYVARVKPAELFLVSMMIATKFLYDEGEEEELYNDEWADAAKMDVNRVHDLEREFLAAIDWKLLVDPLDFYEFLLGVETRIALTESRKRGWLTYTDLSVLMQLPAWYEACSTVLEHMVKVISVCTLVYSLCTAVTLWSALLLQQAHVPPQPTNGCLPLPLGPHLAKSTEPQHLYNHLLLDLVVRLYLDQDPRMTRGGYVPAPEKAPRPHCSVPGYELEEKVVSSKGRLLLPSEDSVIPEQLVATDSCLCHSERQSWDTGNDGVRPMQCATSTCCCQPRSWVQCYHRLATKVGRLRETLVTFYCALLVAWSETPSGPGLAHFNPSSPDRHPVTTCGGCQLERLSALNSSRDALEKEPHQACCQTVSSIAPGDEPLKETRPHSPQESLLVPRLLSLDQNVGFRTSSEILVTM